MEMKLKMHPAVVVTVIVLIVACVGTMFFKAAVDKPAYAGQDAGHPSAMQQGPGGGGGEMKKPNSPEDAQKMGIPGATARQKPAETASDK